jgi:hypothetical protein
MRAEPTTSEFMMIAKATLTARPRRQKPGVIKLLMPPAPPDEKTIRGLNALAAKRPFCQLHRVKKHDPL